MEERGGRRQETGERRQGRAERGERREERGERTVRKLSELVGGSEGSATIDINDRKNKTFKENSKCR